MSERALLHPSAERTPALARSSSSPCALPWEELAYCFGQRQLGAGAVHTPRPIRGWGGGHGAGHPFLSCCTETILDSPSREQFALSGKPEAPVL